MNDPVSSPGRMYAKRLAASGLAALLLAGCASAPTQTYGGARKPAEEVAVLKADGNVLILGIDRRKYRGRAFEILPGERHVRFKATLRGDEVVDGNTGGQRAACMNDAKFVAEAGQTYKLVREKAKRTTTSNTWDRGMRGFGMDFQVLLRDESTNEEIEGAVGICEWKQ